MVLKLLLLAMLLALTSGGAGISRHGFWKTNVVQNDSKPRHSLRPTLSYSHTFSTPVPINPIQSLLQRHKRLSFRRKEKTDTKYERETEPSKKGPIDNLTTIIQQPLEHNPGTLPPLASLQPIVDSVTLRLVRLVTGGKSKFIDTELNIGEGSHKQRVSTPVHILDIPGNGKLPPVVLLHGITSCSADFAPLAYQLRSKFSRVIAIDLLGHGLTPLPNAGNAKPHFSWMTRVVSQVLDNVLPESGNEKAILLGNSMGGLVAMRTALARPDLVDGLFLISPAGGPLTEKEISGLSNIFHISSHEEGTTFIDRMHGQKPAQPLRHLMAWVARGRVNNRAVKNIFDSINPESFMTEQDCRGISVPCALFWGGEEKVLPKQHLDFFRANIPQLSVCNPVGMGHVPQNDDWNFVASRCTEFSNALQNGGETTEGWVRNQRRRKKGEGAKATDT